MQTLLCPAIEVGGGQRWTIKRSNECCLTIQDALPASFDLFVFRQDCTTGKKKARKMS